MHEVQWLWNTFWAKSQEVLQNHIMLKVFEHVENVVATMEEIHRTGKKNSLVVLRTPHYSHPESYRDPTHRWQFTWESFDYFIKDDPKSVLYTDKKFKYQSSGHFKEAKEIGYKVGKELLKKAGSDFTTQGN